MKTTVLIEPDVEALLRKAMKERGISFDEALNSAVRAWFRSGRPARAHRSFRQQTFAMGFRPEIEIDKSLALYSALEDEEIERRLRRGD